MRLATLAALLLAAVSGQPASPAGVAAMNLIDQAKAPADCVAALKAFVPARQQEVRPPTGFTSELLKQVDGERQQLAGRCVARFQGAPTPSELAGLAELYMEAGETAKSKEALDRALAAAVPDADRASTLVSAINLILREPKGDERNARLEAMVDELDADPAATLDQKWSAHSRLQGYYRGDDIDAGILKHGRWMAKAATTLTPEQRRKNGTGYVLSQVDVAEALAGQGMTDEALALLRRTAADWKDVARAADFLQPAIDRYELVGTPAAPIKAPQWLNAPADRREMPMTGAVTLLEFTAHWCGPCRESYPGINRLRERFGARGFRVVLATRYYGYFTENGNTDRDLTNDQELRRDTSYFAGYGLDMPVAIGDLVSVKVVDGKVVYVPGPDPNDEHYKVTGIPQIHLIDKHGRIRLIMIGYDEANEPQLAERIGALLAEK